MVAIGIVTEISVPIFRASPSVTQIRESFAERRRLRGSVAMPRDIIHLSTGSFSVGFTRHSAPDIRGNQGLLRQIHIARSAGYNVLFSNRCNLCPFR